MRKAVAQFAVWAAFSFLRLSNILVLIAHFIEAFPQFGHLTLLIKEVDNWHVLFSLRISLKNSCYEYPGN